MRIGFDAKRATHNFRGLGNYSRGLIEGLDLYFPNTELFLYTPQFNTQKIDNWIKSHPRLTIKLPQKLIDQKLSSIWRSFKLEQEINADQIDIYHGLSHEIPKLSVKRKFKTVVTIHDLIFLRYPDYFPWLDRQIYFRKFKYAMENADLIMAICEQTKKDILHFFNIDPKKIIVHYQSASPNFYHKRDNDQILNVLQSNQLKKPYILNVGAFEERKNQKSAILAFDQIKNKCDLDLVLVGTGKKYLKECIQLVSELKIVKRVHFLLNISFEDLPFIYQGASIFFYPSHFEGFGIPIAEAMFSELPIVVSEGSCFPEIAGPFAQYFNSTNIEQMADKLLQVIANENLQNEMRLRGLEHVSQFTLEHSTQELVKHYRQLL